ncbi:MAG: hypothetical protein IJ165_07710 [Proteobacteria bacterium]|nr:hypothetical protein [Pseudomonadota bacterium]
MFDSIKAGFCFDNAIFEDAPSAHVHLEPDNPLNLSAIRASAKGKLLSGQHKLILQDRAAMVQVSENTSFSIKFACSDDQAISLAIERVSIHFDNPIRLVNIFTTLDEFSALLADDQDSENAPETSDFFERLKKNDLIAKAGTFLEKRAADLKNSESLKRANTFWKENATPTLDKLTTSKGWKKLVGAAEKAVELSPIALEKSKEFLNRAIERSEETIDRAIDGLDLSKIELSGVALSDGKKYLKMNIGGEIIVSEKIRLPFQSIELPRLFLSRFEPEISKLLAQFCVTNDQGASLSKTFLGMIDSLNGTTDIDFNLSPLALQIQARGDRKTQLALKTNRACRAHAKFECMRCTNKLSATLQADVFYHDAKTLAFRTTFVTDDSALIACGQNLASEQWKMSVIGEGCDIEGRIEIESGSNIYPDALELHMYDPRLRESLRIPLILCEMPIEGSISFGLRADNQTIYIHRMHLSANGNVSWDPNQPLSLEKIHTTFPTCSGDFSIEIAKSSNGVISTDISSELAMHLQSERKIAAIPEFSVPDLVRAEASGNIKLSFHASMETQNVNSLVLDCRNSTLEASLSMLHAECGPYAIHTESPILLNLKLAFAALTGDGLTESIIHCNWATENSPVLSIDNLTTNLLLPELLCGKISAHTSEQGFIHFEDGAGFFDNHFFNALLYPEHEKSKLVELLSYQPIQDHLEALVNDLEPSLPKWLTALYRRSRHWFTRCGEFGIAIDLKHAVCMHDLARMLSLFLFDELDTANEIEPILIRIIEARGLDRYKTEELIERAFPDIEIPQLSQILHMLDRVLGVIPFEPPQNSDTTDDFGFAPDESLAILPCANHIFDADILGDKAHELYQAEAQNLRNPEICARIYKYAAGFTVRQLEWLLDGHADMFPEAQQIKLRRLIAIKRRVQKQEPREGSFIVQDFNIDYFLQTILDAEDEIHDSLSDISSILSLSDRPYQTNEIVECFAGWVSPADIAQLLSAGIASRLTSKYVQLNQARLFEYLVKRGRAFTMAVFREAGGYSDRVLTNLLMSFLAQDQELLSHPVDRERELAKLLNLDIPIRKEFLAGGVHASDSYYEKLFQIAHQINHDLPLYEAAKFRLNSELTALRLPLDPNRPMLPPDASPGPSEDEKAEFLRALQKADALGAQFLSAMQDDDDIFEDDADNTHAYVIKQRAPRKSARKAYQYVIRLCASIIQKYPVFMENEDFKKFYARIYESLIIHSVERDLRNDTDDVRHWFSVRSGISLDQITQISKSERIRAIIDVLYYYPDHRERIASDPLTWLGIRPDPGPIDLTILTAMGVITDGKNGKELHRAFERLQRDRDIRIVRADTGNIKSLNFNTEAICREIRKLNSPFLMLGYSQGCANMMSAEATMYASTPDDRKCLKNLVARHFLFSAFNGSSHADCGGMAYQRLLIDGEHLLKTYASLISSQLSDLLFGALIKIFDAPIITTSLVSVESLSWQGLVYLYKTGQFQPGVISTEMQGIIDQYIPETLIYMTTHFKAQTDQVPSDSQVGIDCAHAYPVYYRNASNERLRREAIHTCTLKTHHWSPIVEEAAFLETEQDVRDGVYQVPKDMQILPAIEALLLFGRIKYKSSDTH